MNRVALWGRINNIAFVVVLAAFAVGGAWAVADMWLRFGPSETFNSLGMVGLFTLGLALLWEGFRAVRHRGIPPKWWVSPAVAMAVPLFVLGVWSLTTLPQPGLGFLACLAVIASTIAQKAVESQQDSKHRKD